MTVPDVTAQESVAARAVQDVFVQGQHRSLVRAVVDRDVLQLSRKAADQAVDRVDMTGGSRGGDRRARIRIGVSEEAADVGIAFDLTRIGEVSGAEFHVGRVIAAMRATRKVIADRTADVGLADDLARVDELDDGQTVYAGVVPDAPIRAYVAEDAAHAIVAVDFARVGQALDGGTAARIFEAADHTAHTLVSGDGAEVAHVLDVAPGIRETDHAAHAVIAAHGALVDGVLDLTARAISDNAAAFALHHIELAVDGRLVGGIDDLTGGELIAESADAAASLEMHAAAGGDVVDRAVDRDGQDRGVDRLRRGGILHVNVRVDDQILNGARDVRKQVLIGLQGIAVTVKRALELKRDVIHAFERHIGRQHVIAGVRIAHRVEIRCCVQNGRSARIHKDGIDGNILFVSEILQRYAVLVRQEFAVADPTDKISVV